MFGIFCTAMAIFVAIFVKETKGRTLEEMDLVFGAVDEMQRRADVEQTLQKNDFSHAEHVEEQTDEQAKNHTEAK
jgi:CO/xanthine dehydrogenase FAD-binding subunit